MAMTNRIEVHPKIVLGKPVIRGTRIPVELLVGNAVARLGLADVRAFGLTWEDRQSSLKQLDYDARVEIVAV